MALDPVPWGDFATTPGVVQEPIANDAKFSIVTRSIHTKPIAVVHVRFAKLRNRRNVFSIIETLRVVALKSIVAGVSQNVCMPVIFTPSSADGSLSQLLVGSVCEI